MKPRTRKPYKVWLEEETEKERSFRPMKKEDVPFLIEMGRKNFSYYPEEQLETIEEEFMAAFGKPWWGLPKFFVIDYRNQILGMGGYQLSPLDYDCFELFWISVDENARGLGIGSTIVKRIIEEIKKEKAYGNDRTILLSCRHHLIKFYKKLGFKISLKKAAKESLIMGQTFKIKNKSQEQESSELINRWRNIKKKFRNY